jgi:cyclophilin family peptidyl-prolyl cis-trans isomerase
MSKSQFIQHCSVFFVLVFLTTQQTLAQEEATEEKPAEVATASTAAAGPAAKAFDEAFTTWKDYLQQLRDLKVKYQIADEDEIAGIENSWKELVGKTNEMAGDLQDKALAAYAEAPNENRELVRFLLTVAADQIKNERYPESLKVAKTLIEGGAEERGLNDLAGISAFGCNQFELASEYLKEANDRGTCSQAGQKCFASVEDCQAKWEAELALREAEADDELPRVKLQTSSGDITIELFENEAPETVGNFISLVEQGFYDGLKFHRVLDGFMAQAGCPNGDGSGGPGYNIYCECVNENHRNHFAGSLSMAKERSRNTGGSQFFLTFVPTPHLDGQHTVFGRVVEGMEILPLIHKVDPSDTKSNVEPTKIIKAEVLRKRDHEYRPNKVK